MRIGIFGATGDVGSRITAEAVARGHDVTAFVRAPGRAALLPPRVAAVRADAADARAVAHVASGQDVIVGATRPRPGDEDQLVTMARALLRGAAQAAVRLVLVGGAATLALPGRDGVVLMDDEAFPPELLPIARACAAQLDVCRADRAADWTYVSPPALLEPGERTGRFRLGRDELVLQADGSSRLSLEDFAIAVLDECEHPRHRRERFTAGY